MVIVDSAGGVDLGHLSSGEVFLTVRLMGAHNLERLNSRKEFRHPGPPLTLLDESELLNL